MVKAVQFMKNVVVLEFEWRDLPLTSQSRLLLQVIGANFSTTLRKLVLRARISNFAEFLTISDFNNVDEIDFHFDYVTHDPQDPLDIVLEVEGKGLVVVVAPFINRRARHLRSLIVSSSSRVDLSPFFQLLGPLPKVAHLGLHISFESAHLSDPNPLVNLFVRSRASPKRVDFIPNPPDTYSDDHCRVQPGWTNVARLLQARAECLHNLVFVELPYTTPDTTFPILTRSVSTLQHLKLTGNFLTRDEIEGFLGVFAKFPFQLIHLRIGVRVLDLSLLALLAQRLPALRSLILIYERASAYYDSTDIERVGCPYKGVDHFKIKHAVPAFEGWPLEELSFYHGRYVTPAPTIPFYERGRSYYPTAGHITTSFNIQFGLAFLDKIPSLCQVGGYAIPQILLPPCICFAKWAEGIETMKRVH